MFIAAAAHFSWRLHARGKPDILADTTQMASISATVDALCNEEQLDAAAPANKKK